MDQQTARCKLPEAGEVAVSSRCRAETSLAGTIESRQENLSVPCI